MLGKLSTMSMVFCDLVTGIRQKQNYNTVKKKKKKNQWTCYKYALGF